MRELDDLERGAPRPEAAAPAPFLGRESRDSIKDIWGPRTPYRGEWPARVDERTVEAPERWVRSACVLCSVGCAVDVGVKGGRIVGVRGRAEDPTNRGRLGPKGLHGWEANASGDRLTRPLVRRGGRLVPASWDEAMGLIVARTREVLARAGSGALGFYTSGQLLLEEYYTLAVVAHIGLRTPHLDGNTRLCTATAARALIESFGSDGQPGSFADIDTTDALLLVGHNMASQQTVMWARVLDRRRGPQPPRLVVVDPRRTESAREADVHLAPRAGTNVALLNGLLRAVIAAGHVDRAWIEAHTLGFEELRATVEAYTPARVAEITGVPAERLLAAARILGEAPTLVSTVLQGVYQSPQATAAAVQVNNLHLVRGLLGKPGATVFQMNGQPTSQNTRETGCDGAMPAFRNWENRDDMVDLARVLNVAPEGIPAWGPPTHALQVFRLAEEGTIKLLWISATNPAVSMPHLSRMRALLAREELFVIAQDGFPTETTRLADVVLPAAIWGEKTGTFTNTDRSVHLAEKAIEPPGEARSDLDIFLDFARRMDFRDRDGAPLVKWRDPGGAFEAWKECSRGRPCDYSGLTYERLRRGSVRWPVNERWPDGRARLYEDGLFPTDADRCQSYGHDLTTGAAKSVEERRALDPRGRALIRAAEYLPPPEEPDAEYPLLLTTGRVVHHFHTRTKTGRARALQDAAPDVFVELSRDDARALGLEEGDFAAVRSRRGEMRGRVRVTDIEPGHVFVPFHWGDWDDGARRRAANELTLEHWDAASKQPTFKYAAVSVTKVASLDDSLVALARTAVGERARALVASVTERVQSWRARRHVKDQLARLAAGVRQLGVALETIARRHAADPEVVEQCRRFARALLEDRAALATLRARHGRAVAGHARALRGLLLRGGASGYGLIVDLEDAWLLAQDVSVTTLALIPAARALDDADLHAAAERARARVERLLAWMRTRIQHAAAQALAVPS